MVLLGVLVSLAFITADIPHPYDTGVSEVNVANIQNSGHTNQYQIGTYLLANFNNNWKGLYYKQCSICSLMWSQIGAWQSGANPPSNVCQADCTVPGCSCGGGGGGCAIVDPLTSILTLDGAWNALPGVEQIPLTRLGVAEDGRAIVVDEYAMVHVGMQGAAFQQMSAKFQQSRNLIDALASHAGLQFPPASMPRVRQVPYIKVDSTAQAGPEALRKFTALVIQHQREHPANANFAPTPRVTFKPQPYGDHRAQGQRGFAIVDLGESRGGPTKLDSISRLDKWSSTVA